MRPEPEIAKTTMKRGLDVFSLHRKIKAFAKRRDVYKKNSRIIPY